MNDDRLRRLLNDAVSDVEPEDRIEELRASVRPKPSVVRHFHARPWYAAAGIVAAVICMVAFITSVAGNDPAGPGFATQGGSSLPSRIIATDPSATAPTSSAVPERLTVYYVGHGPQGDVLFTESVAAGSQPLHTALSALTTIPRDPDYRTGWLAGSVTSAELKHGVVEVELGAMRAKRPHGMSGRTADEIVQQAVYTFQAASGRRDAKVQFLRHHRPAPTVLGVRTDHPLSPGRATDVLSRMTIASPAEGQTIRSTPFVVTGTNNAPEGTVHVTIIRSTPGADQTVLSASGTATGTGDPNRVYAWRVPVDTSDLPPGTYTLVASNDDPSGGDEGLPPATDTRTIVLE
jgi:Immunoglobulin-like domain of bacterial spore germination